MGREHPERSARGYLLGASTSLIAKVLSTVSAFVSLWFLTQILAPEEFGSFAVAMAWVTLTALLATSGLDTSLLYVVAQSDPNPGQMQGGGVLRWVVLGAALLGCVLTLLLGSSVLLLRWGGALGGISRWLLALAPLIPLSTISAAFEAWYQANHRIVEMLILPRIVDVTRALFLAVVWVAGAGSLGVMVAYLGSWMLGPLVWIFLPASRAALQATPIPLTWANCVYGFKLMLARLINNFVERLDLLMLGVMTPAAAVAQFVVAARFSTPIGAPKDLFGPVFTPRIRRLVSGGDSSRVEREYRLVQHYYFGTALLIAIVLSLAGPRILQFYGGYGGAYPLLLLLMAAYVIKMAFGPATSFLSMSGGSGFLLIITSVSLITMGSLNVILIPRLGAAGAAIGTVAGVFIVNVLVAILVWRRDGFVIIPPFVLLMLLVVLGAVLLGYAGYVSVPVIGVVETLALLLVFRKTRILQGQ